MTTLPLSPDLMDTFRSLSVKKRQGVLEIISPKREYELTFFEGKIIHADRVDRSFLEFLGEKVPSVAKLPAELENVGRGEQITRLLQLTELELSRLIDLKKEYDRETLLQLAEESSFSFDFRTKIVRCPEGLSLELSPGHYLLDLLEGTTAQEEQPVQETKSEVAPRQVPLESEVKEAAKIPEPIVAATAISVEVPKPKVAKGTAKKKSRNRKSRRPPKAGRFRETSGIRKSQFAGGLKLSEEQIVTGLKLGLILLLAVYGPGFILEWYQSIVKFMSL